MSQIGLLVIYSLLVVLVSLLGGYLPVLGRITHSKLQLCLSLSAGVMLGAAFFHIMPEAIRYSGSNFGWWMTLGVVGLFCIERFIAPHSHEVNEGHHHHHHKEDELTAGHNHGHEHFHSSPADDHRAAAPAVAGWMAVLGLTIHTFMNGVGLAGEVEAEWLTAAIPGLAIFVAIVAHKPADALAISTVLSRKGVSRRAIILVQLGFATMVPLGVAAFRITQGSIAKDLESQLIGAALAFSAGTFLFVALSDLLPEVQFHRHDRIPLFLALVLGVSLMGGIAYLEGHDEHGHSHGVSTSHHDGENHHDHEADHDHDHGK
jgi:zinc and cadmium transporter